MAARAAPRPDTTRHGWRSDRPLLLACAALAAVVTALAASGEARLAWWTPAPPSVALVAADLRGHALLVFDPSKPDTARRIPLPGGPHELLRLPDGRVVVSLEQRGALAVVDLDGGIVQTVEVGGIPHGLAVEHGVLTVTDRSADVLRRFALGTWAELPPQPVARWPHAVQAFPGGGLAVASADADLLTVNGRGIAVSELPETVTIALDGRIATAGAAGGVVEVFDADGQRRARHEVGGRPVRVAFSPDGRTLVAALSAAGTAAIVTEGAVRYVAVGGVPDGLAFSPDGRWLYVADTAYGHVSTVEVARARLVSRVPVGDSAGALLALP
ncbi:MAG: hypothetical protein WD734_03815 [Dehalococcoidia bacterium]